MLIVGLTGGIACGKSTVSRRLQEKYKFPIVDADLIARQIVEPGQPAYVKIVDHFQDKVEGLLFEDGHLNRGALGSYVFAHQDELKVLNHITHPIVRYTMLEQVIKYYIKGYRLCILDVPLLLESHLDKFCGITINVLCDTELQLERLQIRNPDLTIEDARNRINSQLPMEERRDRSDYIIENNGTLQDLYDKIDKIVKTIEPGPLRGILEYFPPIGALSASSIFVSKLIASKLKK